MKFRLCSRRRKTTRVTPVKSVCVYKLTCDLPGGIRYSSLLRTDLSYGEVRISTVVGSLLTSHTCGPQAGDYPCFCGMKRLGVFVPTPSSPLPKILAGLSSTFNSPVPIYTPGWREAL